MATSLTPLDGLELSWARRRLAAGHALADTADRLGVTAAELDLALWGALGARHAGGFEHISAPLGRLMDGLGLAALRETSGLHLVASFASVTLSGAAFLTLATLIGAR